MKKEIYKKRIKEEIKYEESKDYCFLCGEDDKRILEKHHWQGRANSDEIIMLCPSCHRKQTMDQNKLAPQQRSKNADPEMKRFNMLRNHLLFQRDIAESGLKITEMIIDDRSSCKNLFKTKI